MRMLTDIIVLSFGRKAEKDILGNEITGMWYVRDFYFLK